MLNSYCSILSVIKSPLVQNVANALAEVKANAITHAMKKKLEKVLNGGGSSKPKTKPESSDLDEIQGSNPIETESSGLDEIQGSNSMETDTSHLDVVQGSKPIKKNP